MGWAGGHIGAVWAVFIQVRVAAGGHICPQQGGGKHAQRRRDRAPRRNEGAHGPVGVAVPSQAPQLACLLPTAHSESHLASVWLKPAAVAIRQSGRSGLLCGVVGEPHKRQARERARSRCNDHGARRMRGKRAVSKAGLCRRQQARRMGQRRTRKVPRSDKKQKTCGAKRPRVYVCACEGGFQSNKHQTGAVGAVGDGAQEPRGQLPPVLGGQNSRPNGSHGTSRTRERSS